MITGRFESNFQLFLPASICILSEGEKKSYVLNENVDDHIGVHFGLPISPMCEFMFCLVLRWVSLIRKVKKQNFFVTLRRAVWTVAECTINQINLQRLLAIKSITVHERIYNETGRVRGLFFKEKKNALSFFFVNTRLTFSNYEGLILNISQEDKTFAFRYFSIKFSNMMQSNYYITHNFWSLTINDR